ncbi:MAG: endonuclease III [Pseudomonadota bacterium]
MDMREKVANILRVPDELYFEARTALNYGSPLELLVATILSAQCTDERVNQVTAVLFGKYRNAGDYAEAPLERLEGEIRPTGFFRNKARSIKGCCQALLSCRAGEVPPDLDTLVKLPGVGRKTANVVLGSAFGIPAITVDTHVARVTGRLGLTSQTDPVKIEFDLMEKLPRERWTRCSNQIIWHGRRICLARRPKCPVCKLLPWCDYGRKLD